MFQDLKGEGLENWNWQVKEKLSKAEAYEQVSPAKRGEVKEEFDNIDDELVKMDQEIEMEGGTYFKKMFGSKL